jgi:hypothetical protein
VPRITAELNDGDAHEQRVNLSGSTRRGDVMLHERGHHLQPGANRQGQQPLAQSSASSATATLTDSGTASPLERSARSGTSLLTTVLFLVVFLVDHPSTYRVEGLR